MDTKIVGLTAREREVFNLIVERNPSIEEIAKILDVTPGTVSQFINKIYFRCEIEAQRRYKRAELLHQYNTGEIIIIDKPST